jgi:hypothetical protein
VSLGVEGLLRNQSNENRSRHNATEISSKVEDRPTGMSSVENFSSFTYSANGVHGDDIVSTGMLYFQMLVHSGNRPPEDWHLLGPKSSFVERSCEKTSNSARHHDSNHHGNEEVNGSGSFEHDDD